MLPHPSEFRHFDISISRSIDIPNNPPLHFEILAFRCLFSSYTALPRPTPPRHFDTSPFRHFEIPTFRDPDISKYRHFEVPAFPYLPPIFHPSPSDADRVLIGCSSGALYDVTLTSTRHLPAFHLSIFNFQLSTFTFHLSLFSPHSTHV